MAHPARTPKNSRRRGRREVPSSLGSRISSKANPKLTCVTFFCSPPRFLFVAPVAIRLVATPQRPRRRPLVLTTTFQPRRSSSRRSRNRPHSHQPPRPPIPGWSTPQPRRASARWPHTSAASAAPASRTAAGCPRVRFGRGRRRWRRWRRRDRSRCRDRGRRRDARLVKRWLAGREQGDERDGRSEHGPVGPGTPESTEKLTRADFRAQIRHCFLFWAPGKDMNYDKKMAGCMSERGNVTPAQRP